MRKATKIYELIIIGGGVAGTAAAVYAKNTLPGTLLAEKGKIGGKVNEISLVDNYTDSSPTRGRELGLAMEKQLLENNSLVKKLEVTSIQKKENFFIVKGHNHSFCSYSVVIATGSDWKKLELRGIRKTHYRSFSYKAASDAHLTKGRAVLVVGGGYSGCQVAGFLAGFAEKVYLIHKGKELAVDSQLKNRILKNSKIETYLNSIPLGTGGGEKLESCVIATDNHPAKELKVSMIFPCIGTVANSGLVSEIVACAETGSIKVNNNFQTSIEGLFAAGDVTEKGSSQITAAATEGTEAARAAVKYLLRKV